ncbi:MAG: thioredoxin family protein [Myxococcota bacterium]|nr:thioredoxin family protein [Myxococcota bacterium]
MITVASLFALTGAVHSAGLSLPPPGWEPPPPVAFDGVPESGSKRPENQPGKPHQVHARLLFDQTSVEPGGTLRVGLHLDQDENWHTYWKSPGDIGLPTEIQWSTPPGVTVSPYEYPVPHKFDVQDIISYGYEQEVLLYTEMVFPANTEPGTYTVGLSASWLVCEVSCIPGSVELERSVEVLDSPPSPSTHAPLFEHAQSFHPGPLPDGVSIRGQVEPAVVKPEQPFTVTLDVEHAGVIEHDATGWPFFAPIAGEQWMILETSISTRDGGTRIVLTGETFAPDAVPVNDSVGGLFQFPFGDGVVRHEFSVPLVWDQPAATASASGPNAPSVQEPSGDEPQFGLMLLMAFLGGMLLNIMPCVLPVLSLKIYSLVEQHDADVSDRQRAGLGYTIGVVLSFLALGGTVIAFRTVLGLEVGWGYQFQAPEYVIALATIVFVFGLSLFGVFEVPAFGATSMAQAQEKEGMAGHILTGAFATLLATPCSAPFLGTGMGFAFTLPGWGILLFFTAAGLGLAAPFLLIAYIPALARFLPKPGAWMETFKQFMGFTLVATTVWLVDVLAAQTGPDGAVGFLAFLVVVSVGCWIVGRWGGPIASDRSKVTALLVAFGLSVAAGAQFLVTDFAEPEPSSSSALSMELDFSEEMPWQAFTEARVDELAGHTIFIDFTADWCLSCKANEKTVLASQSVRDAMKENGVIPLKADWTRRDPVITQWLARYGKAGVPFYLIIPGDRTKAHIPLPEVITPGIVIGGVRRAVQP